jgi:DNA-damage-inducible protein J
MATTNITIRMDEELKKQFNHFCDEIGMSMGTAMTIFAKTVVKEGRIPFELSVKSPNRETIEAMMETERISRDPKTKRYTNFMEAVDEVMADEQI